MALISPRFTHRPNSDLTGEIIDGRFRVERFLGAGGMGTVWRAQHVRSLQFVALKALSVSDNLPDAAIQRCLKEARAAAALKSRHVVRVIDVNPHYLHNGAPLPYLIMDLLQGSDFESILKQKTFLTKAETIWVMRQVCRGIQFAHEHGIVHRDLKPANLFLTTDDEEIPIVKICDFGLAKLIYASSDILVDQVSTQTGSIIGTPRYMAPEQLRGSAPATGTLDQWALGLVAFRLLSGRDYFCGASTPVDLALRIFHDDFPLPSQCSPRIPVLFDDWFLRSCHRDPAQRFSSVGAQAEALQVALGDPSPAAVVPLSLRSSIESNHSEVTHPSDKISSSSQYVTPRGAPRFYMILGSSFALCLLGTVALASELKKMTWTSQSREIQSVNLPRVQANTRSPVKAPQLVQSILAQTLTTEPTIPKSKSTRKLDLPRISKNHSSFANPVSSMLPIPDVRLNVPLPPAPTGLAPGNPCERSFECLSRLCVAERCR
jgi:serine/threonine protein kinase